MIDYSQYKAKEFLGDALIKFVTAEIIFKNFKGGQHERHEKINQINNFICNNNLSILARKLGLNPHPDDFNLKRPGKEPKEYANAMEVYIWDLYLCGGMPVVKSFVIQYLIKN